MKTTSNIGRHRESSADVIPLDPSLRGRPAPSSGAAPIRVLLAESEGLMRAALRALLEREPGIAVVAEAASDEEAVALSAHVRPAVVVIPFRLAGSDALDTARRIVADPALDDVKVLMLSDSGSDADLFGALRAGASGVVVKSSDASDLHRAVRSVADGHAELSPSLTRRLIEEFAAQPDPGGPAPEQLSELTAREREVLTLVAMGLTNREIAERLVVSPATAKTHVSRAMVKLGAHDRAKLVTIAYDSGLVRPRSDQPSSGAGICTPERHLAAA